MLLPLDPDAVAHGIQLSVAPVFLLTAVTGMIGAVANRLARIIDRARLLEQSVVGTAEASHHGKVYDELAQLRRRGLLANCSIALLTLCAVCIGLTIMVLFLGETLNFQGLRISIVSFLAGVVFFQCALVCFLVETWIATRVLKFAKAKENWS
jgi:Na+/melibiose symporter-like transporter